MFRFMSKNDIDGRMAMLEGLISRDAVWRESMADVTIVYWRDMPAQVIVGKGRRGAKKQLPERFEQAIDRCAMKVGAKDDDAYLAEWRKVGPATIDGESDQAVAEAEASRLEADFDLDRIKTLIANDGWDQPR